MRILFASTPGAGHVQPMIGLALAARERGHAVAWATAHDAWPLLQSRGIETLEAGTPLAPLLAAYRSRWPETAALQPREQAAHGFPRLFAQLAAEAMLPALMRVTASWRPDLVIHEPAALAAPLAAAAHGVRHLTHAFGVPLPASILNDTTRAVAPAWRATGLEPPPHAGLYLHGSIEIVPPALQSASIHRLPAGRVIAQQPATVTGGPGDRLPDTLAAFLAQRAGCPLIYATFGTLYSGGAGFNALQQALRRVDAAVVVTTGRAPPMPDLPSHVWAGGYVPQDLVLPQCSAVVSHGGAGTVLAALAAGLPQLCLPQGADHFRNAEALRACGAAAVLEPAVGVELDPATIAAATLALLDDAGLRRAAQALQAQIRRMPTPADTVATLESF